jgi:hypothetical protein
MNSDIISWAIALELSLPFIVSTIILSILLMKGKKKSKTSVRALILNIKNNEEQQKEKLQQYLANKLLLNEKQVKSVSKKVINERKFLFRNLISGILDNNAEELAGLEDDLSRITDHYHNLDIKVQSDKPEVNNEAVAEVTEEDNEAQEAFKREIKTLKQEAKALKHEVHVTLTTLNNIFSEFSSMFGEKVPDTEMSVEQIIAAMETFSGKAEIEETVSEKPEPMPKPQSQASTFSQQESAVEEDIVEDISIEEATAVEINVEASADIPLQETSPIIETETEESNKKAELDELDFSIDSELDDIDSALDDLELGQSQVDDEPSWDDAFEESGDTVEDEK